MSTITKFCLVCNTFDDGSRTFEDYDTLQDVLYAYYYVTLMDEHKPQNGNGEVIAVPNDATWSIDVEVWDLDTNSCTFDDIDNYINYLN